MKKLGASKEGRRRSKKIRRSNKSEEGGARKEKGRVE